MQTMESFKMKWLICFAASFSAAAAGQGTLTAPLLTANTLAFAAILAAHGKARSLTGNAAILAAHGKARAGCWKGRRLEGGFPSQACPQRAGRP
jgi:hypothetical protein